MRAKGFEWDDEKSAENERKGRPPCNEAMSVFEDPDVMIDYDAWKKWEVQEYVENRE